MIRTSGTNPPRPVQLERTIANTIMENFLVLTLRETDEFCLYNGGCFHRGKEPLSRIRTAISRIAESLEIETGNGRTKAYNLTMGKRNTILEILKAETFISLKEFDKDPHRICVKNGMVLLYPGDNYDPNHECAKWENFDETEYYMHDALVSFKKYAAADETPYKTFVQVPVEYDPKAECPAIEAFLTSVFGPKYVDLIYEMLAYFLMPHVKYQKAFILYGPPSSGKTTFINMIFKFFNGLKYFSQVRLQDLGERFQLINLMGKLVNVFDDLPDRKIGDTDIFRQVVTNEYLRSEVKFQPEYVEWRNRTKLLFTCNTLPEIRKKEGDQFFRRWILIPCFTIFKDPDKMTEEDVEDPSIRAKNYNILDDITTPSEFSGLLNKIIDGWIRLESRGYFPKEWSDTEYIKGLWQIDINPVKLFVDECCIVGNDKEEDYETFYEVLNKFREERNARPISKHACTQWLQKIDGVKKKRRGGGDYYYEGIAIKKKYKAKYLKDFWVFNESDDGPDFDDFLMEDDRS